MEIAYASSGATEAGSLGAFIPLLLVGCIFGYFLSSIAKRKGKNRTVYFISAFFPPIGILCALWLASLPDKAILERINTLEEKLKMKNVEAKEPQVSFDPPELKTWKCNCGLTNNFEVSNCSECGLKRDYLLKQTSFA